MDRIDLKCWVAPLGNDAFNKSSGESSARIRQRVVAARRMQQERYEHAPITRNAELGPGLFERFCKETKRVVDALKKARRKLKLSTRGLDKLRAVARTCADLRQSATVEVEDVARAVEFMEVPLPEEGYGNRVPGKTNTKRRAYYVHGYDPQSKANPSANNNPEQDSRDVIEDNTAELPPTQPSRQGNEDTGTSVPLEVSYNTAIGNNRDGEAPIRNSSQGYNNAANCPIPGRLSQATEQWLQYVQTTMAASTHQGYGKVIRRLARSIDKCPEELATQDILSYLHSHLQRGVSRHTVNTWLLTIRSFLGWAAQQGLVAPQLRQQLPSSISYELSQPVAATEQEVDLILSQGRLPAPYQLAVVLMFDSGLRVSEAAQLRWGDVDLAGRTINVLGKGNKRRLLPIASLRLYQMLAAASEEAIRS